MEHVLRSGLLEGLGFRHGFNLRTGGVSAAPYASFNLGRAVGDEAADVAENHRRFAQAVGYAYGALFERSQVHGRSVHRTDVTQSPAEVRRGEGDALIAAAGGIAVGVRVADCLPLLLADASSGAVAAVHAGWRGVVAGVVGGALSELRSLASVSAEPSVSAAIFPHIGPCCFEVGDDVAEHLATASSASDAVDRSRPRPHVDLAAIVTAQLRDAGLDAALVDRIPGCTRCEPDRFFSYRRQGKASGRHLAAIVSRACATSTP